MSAPSTRPYRLYGMAPSYFTRKIQAYFEYKSIPYLFRRFGGAHPAARAAGWPGGIPVVQTPDGGYMWDTTAMMLYLEDQEPEPSILPTDPVQRFLCFAIEDVVDEWLYRPAVGSRWFFPRNREHGSWEIARDVTCETPIPCHQAAEMVADYVTASCEAFGVSQDNVQAWIDEVLLPWVRVLNAHFEATPFLFGDRPSLADFALFGANAAHFINDPVCRGWLDEHGPAVVQHTHRLLHPEDLELGAWAAPGDVPDSLIAVLRDMGRLYLPWVTRATVVGEAELAFTRGDTVTIAASAFLKDARAVLLARYEAAKSEELEAVLERAGVGEFFAGHSAEASAVPRYAAPPQPQLNRSFAPSAEVEAATFEQVTRDPT